MFENWGRGKKLLETGESLLSLRGPSEGGTRGRGSGQGSGHLTVVANESPVKVSEAEESLELLAGSGSGPVGYSLNLGRIGLKLALGDDVA